MKWHNGKNVTEIKMKSPIVKYTRLLECPIKVVYAMIEKKTTFILDSMFYLFACIFAIFT